MKRLLISLFLLILCITGYIYLLPQYATGLSEREIAALNNASLECKEPWENVRIVRQATTDYIDSATESGFSILYYEQVVGPDRHRTIALYQGPKKTWKTCAEKRQNRYANTATLGELGDGTYPYAITIFEGSVALQFTRNKKRAVPLEKLPIIGGPKTLFIEDEK
jgi:hypothetical protein